MASCDDNPTSPSSPNPQSIIQDDNISLRVSVPTTSATTITTTIDTGTSTGTGTGTGTNTDTDKDNIVTDTTTTTATTFTSPEGGASQDELILRQQKEIAQEISDSIPLVGERVKLQSLSEEYSDDVVYGQKAKYLMKRYQAIRKTRPDGNCFFRAFSYAYLEHLLTNRKEYEKFYEFAKLSKDKLVSLGFSLFAVEDFYETFMEVVEKVGANTDEDITEASKSLHKIFNDQSYSDYIVVYLRLITSGQLQTDHEFYQNFIEGERSVPEFCIQEVEPMYKESDHIHIIALCNALNVSVTVRYMDRGEGDQVIAHDFPDGSTPLVHLLYRPGHYDILYV